jgi:hypothetical protein
MINRIIAAFIAVMCLICCLASPFLYFWGKVSENNFKWIFLWASALYFIFAVLWASARKKDRRRG